MQGDGDDHAFEQQGDQSGNEEMWRVLQIGLPADAERQDARVDRKEIKQCEHAILIQQHEAHEDQGARQEMGDIAIERSHRDTRETNSMIVPRSPSMSATPRNSGTRNTRILAVAVSNMTSRNASAASLIA